jgi:hypothetical protein
MLSPIAPHKLSESLRQLDQGLHWKSPARLGKSGPQAFEAALMPR